MSLEPIVHFKGLNKRFDGLRALENINLDIYPGSITAVVGANGCGKSTLLRHIIGLYLPSEGICTTFGIRSSELDTQQLQRIGYVHQEGRLVPWMTVEEQISYVAQHYPSWNKKLETRYLELFELDRSARVGNLSPGKRQQLAILLAIGFEPELLILDEPAAGLDPRARREFLHLLLEMILDGKRSILISSHILTDVEKIIDHVVILDKGSILRDCDFDVLQEEFLKLQVESLNGPLPFKLPFENLISIERDEHQAVIVIKNPGVNLAPVAETAGIKLQRLPLGFEDIYELVQQSVDRRPGAFR